ncbi:MAG: MFS transporter [Parvibaculum sp.]|uniref:spinster family MFS transporter n=1 Tax=Parvibaculum sp. TaxID=2024848 RepID=UPI0025E497B8|nr:MFS transporter [Parvibaculum sp.]MCE9649528.1 MFS transporter [Parvibaculum sp.]
MAEIEVASEVEDVLHNPPHASADETPYPSRIYAWYVVGVFVLAYTFSFIDRQILSLLVGPMKRDLLLSDTQISLLLGIAFAIFYVFMGLPIGRLVDRRRRISIIAVGVLAWSVMTAMSGTAKAYWQLFVYRMGVGVGEAALTPAAYSIISDYFPPKRLGIAIGVYGIGVYIGAGAALVIGAFAISWATHIGDVDLPIIGHVFSWQLVFFVVGLPGILVALWVSTLREPVRRGHMRREVGADGVARDVEVPFREVLAYLRANAAAFLAMNFCFALLAMMAYGTAAWVPTFFVRTYGWTPAEIGRAYGLIIMVFGTLGVISGGALGDFVCARGYRNGRIIVMACTGLVTMPFAIAFPLVDNPNVSLALLAPASFFATFTTGVGPSALIEMMPNQMRGFASALSGLIVNLIGLGLGPTAIALVTDYVFKDEQMLRYSLAYVPPIVLLAGALIGFLALRPYLKSLDYLQVWSRQHEKS